MPRLILTTRINAPAEVCFDLARNIDLHMETMSHAKEKAIGGITGGLIGFNETVTWRARHFGFIMKITNKITEYRFPLTFTDEMLEGPLKMMAHRHLFEQKKGYTLMIDEFVFESSFGFLGKVADALILEKYIQKLLRFRNHIIKQKAELEPEYLYDKEL